MAETKLMRADELANAFNGVEEREYWRATLAGSRLNPEVHFNSRASMVCVAYRVAHDNFTVSFAKTACAFGDYMASAYRSMRQVLDALKAAGLPVPTLDDTDGTLRIEYSPNSKEVTVYIAVMGDTWVSADPIPFKVPVRNNLENVQGAIDNGYAP